MRSFLNEYLLLWALPTLFLGATQKLEAVVQGDRKRFFKLPSELKSENVIPEAKAAWAEKRSLYHVVKKLSKRELSTGLIASFGGGLFSVVIRPLLLRELVDLLQSDEYDRKEALILLFILVGALFMEGWAIVVIKHSISDILAHKMFTGFSALVHQKSQRLSIAGNSGDVISLVGNDVYRVMENLRFFCLFFFALTGLLSGIAVLVFTLGKASLVGIVMMLLMMAGNLLISKLAAEAEEKDLEAASTRLSLLRQMISGIKAVKLCAWEKPFIKKIAESRLEEMKCLARYRILAQSGVQLGRASPVICAAVSFIFFALSGQEVIPADLFAALNVFLALRLTLIILPESITYIAAMNVSFKRIEKFLNQPELPSPKLMEPETLGQKKSTPEAIENEDSLRLIASCSWPNNDRFHLSVDLNIAKGRSLAIIGGVGSGTTSLLLTLLDQLSYIPGNSVNKSVPYSSISYISQKPFVLNGSIRENVTMTENPVESEFQESIKKSTLVKDLNHLTYGINTMVGERGINISGGQQQRIAIARSVYFCKQRKNVLLLADDPLAAVDGDVADELFENVFMEHMKSHGNGLIMVLNQVKYLERFDYIAEMNKGKLENILPSSDPYYKDISRKREQVSTLNEDETEPDHSDKKPQEELDNKDPNDDDLVDEDYNQQGSLKFNVVQKFISGMGFPLFVASLTAGIITYSAQGFSDMWFTAWLGIEDPDSGENRRFVIVYASSIIGFVVFLIATSVLFSLAGVRSSTSLHNSSVNNLLHCPISFFEKTSSGRIISRFTTDMSNVDLNLSRFLDNFYQLFCVLLSQVVIVSILVPPVIIVLGIAAICYCFQVVAVDRTNRVVKRQQNLAMSPLQLTLSENLESSVPSRTMGFNCFFNRLFQERVDDWTRFGILSLGIINTSMLLSYILSMFISASTGLYIILGKTLSPERAGLALTYSFLIPYFMLNVGYIFTLVMSGFNSLERVIDYAGDTLPSEPEWEKDGDEKQWLTQGKIEFQDVFLQYREGLKPALRNLSFTIQPSEKVGIIGRSGAGKSSIVLLLLRLVDPSSGKILLDGRDTTKIGLQTLRRSVCIIPQSPLLLKGTVRENITPFGEACVDDLILALRKSGLLNSLTDVRLSKKSPTSKNSKKVLPFGKVDESNDVEKLLNTDAESLSAGQKQLLSLARCLLRTDNKILICDEPTSNVDVNTDKLVQQAVKQEFAKSTILTIAHRLDTLVDTDKILEMEQGQLVRFAPTREILSTVKQEFFSE
eukprot:augustus_masked-scaffold_3-processed-gene-21.99-mRNA-1 protein AED:0.04 eAED:0.04 QI:0/-1/0/1/-1/1/1/0/1256